jgi:uncharacterized protein YecE (DUF72 family)
MKWHIGCSGFHYRNWKPEFYPKEVPQRLWFEYYTNHFNSLEVNNTFYKFPKIESLESWYKRSPEDFLFTIKVPRLITHFKKFVEVKSLLDEFYLTVSKGLKEKLGSVLFQLPPDLQYSEFKLKQITSQLSKDFINVVEFRHESWWNENVFQHLAKNKITFCSISHPTLPDNIIFNTSVAYIRMHGKPLLYKSEYNLNSLKHIIKVVTQSKIVKEVYVYFNNDSVGAAHRNARKLMRVIRINA